VNTVPGAQTTNEDTNKVFTGGTAQWKTDVEVDAANLQETLAVTNGALTLGSIAGLTFTVGNGTADATMTFTGTLAAINTAISSITFIPTANVNGSATLTFTSNDQGNTGAGGALSDVDTVTINITAINDAPVNTVPGAQTTNEDTNKVFTGGT